MFVIAQSPTFWAPVQFESPAAQGGARTVASFDVEFPRLTRAELAALGERIDGERLDDAAVARHLVRNWNGIHVADGGESLPYSAENLDLVLNIAGTASAIVFAFRRAQAGAARGNS
jgi:hypothetical protein